VARHGAAGNVQVRAPGLLVGEHDGHLLHHGLVLGLVRAHQARHAKNPANAVKFLEYLASPEAQNYFANGNNEWPTAKGVTVENAALKAMSGGTFKSETIPVSAVGMNQIKVQQMLDRVGFK